MQKNAVLSVACWLLGACAGDLGRPPVGPDGGQTAAMDGGETGGDQGDARTPGASGDAGGSPAVDGAQGGAGEASTPPLDGSSQAPACGARVHPDRRTECAVPADGGPSELPDAGGSEAGMPDAGAVDASVPDAGGSRRFVVGLSTGQHSGTFDAIGQAFTKELGTHSLRLAYNHGDYVAGVDWAAQNGMSTLFMLGYGVGLDPKTAAGRQSYAQRSADLAQKFGNKVTYYEVWNEWDGGFGLGCGWGQAGTPCTDAPMYTDLLCRTYAAVKAVRPSAIIIGGVTTGVDIDFISKMLDAGAGNCMDMVSVHPYVFTETKFSVPYDAPTATGVAKFVEAVSAVHDLVLRKTGKDMKVAVTEDGRTDKLSAANYPSTADYISAVYAKGKTIPFLEGIWFYQLEDVPNDVKGYGLVTSDNVRKPAFAAFKAAAQ